MANNTSSSGTGNAPESGAFGHGGFAMGEHSQNTTPSGVPSGQHDEASLLDLWWSPVLSSSCVTGTGAREGVAEGRPAGLTGAQS